MTYELSMYNNCIKKLKYKFKVYQVTNLTSVTLYFVLCFRKKLLPLNIIIIIHGICHLLLPSININILYIYIL